MRRLPNETFAPIPRTASLFAERRRLGTRIGDFRLARAIGLSDHYYYHLESKHGLLFLSQNSCLGALTDNPVWLLEGLAVVAPLRPRAGVGPNRPGILCDPAIH
jgi:hypothetical protein